MKYQLIKYAVVGLTTISRLTSTASPFKPELRVITYYTEPVKQVLMASGNALWNYELAQQSEPKLESEEVEEQWISLN